MKEVKSKFLAIGNMSYGQSPSPVEAVTYMVNEHSEDYGELRQLRLALVPMDQPATWTTDKVYSGDGTCPNIWINAGNMPVFAAAHDMLEALKHAAAIINIANDWDMFTEECKSRELEEKLYSAIAKAEGK